MIAPLEDLPKSFEIGGEAIEMASMTAADSKSVMAFARALPESELLFLPRDIREPKVVAAWIARLDDPDFQTLLIRRESMVIGCGTLAIDPHSWSPHVAEIRCVILPEWRGKGLGVRLIQEIFRLALILGAKKVTARMTTDQLGAIASFEGLGFSPEAVLRAHVSDHAGALHDLLVLSHDVAAVAGRSAAYGVGVSYGDAGA